MGAKNCVIAGDYENKQLTHTVKGAVLLVAFLKTMPLDKTTVESYEVMTDEHRKSAASGVARGLIGGALLGPVGILAGGLSAKNKGTYTVAIQFKDGKKSLVEIDDKVYKALMKAMF